MAPLKWDRLMEIDPADIGDEEDDWIQVLSEV